MAQKATAKLLNWYDAHARKLPWRGIADPYRTWISETMLQQTRVETVLGYYARFLERFPNVESLASAPEDEVLKLWEGLGYYSRARNLHKGARQVVSEYGGKLPASVEALRKISGIGPYTAGAIASIAFGQPVPAVDGNAIRVISRLAGIRENVGIPSIKRQIEAEAAARIPADRPGDFNQALMDLGASVCTPGTPECERCPLCTECDACTAGDADDLPVMPRKSPPKQLEYDVCLVFCRGRVLMRQRSETMLKGLWVYPMLDTHHAQRQLPAAVKRLTGLTVRHVSSAGDAKHVFTHQIWNMTMYTMDAADDDALLPGWRFVTPEEMEALAIPSAMKGPLALAREFFAASNDGLC